MKIFLTTLTGYALLLIFLLLLNGCAPTYYGVPEEEWQKMGEPERVAAIEGYNERQRIREQRRLEEQKRRRLEAEQQARVRKEHVDSIYNGSSGQFGDLLRVSMRNGKIRIGGKHRTYRPVSFKIADQECKAIPVVYEKKYYSYSGEVAVCYIEGSLLVDAGKSNRHGAVAITYDSGWARGKTYTNINSNGRGDLEGVTVFVQAVSASGRNNVMEHIIWR